MHTSQLVALAREHYGLDVDGSARAMAAGNINRSVVLGTDDGSVVLQEMNTAVFGDVATVMGNIERILARLREHNLSALELVRTVDGANHAVADGVPWRCYRFVEGQATPPITTPEEAQATARAFGRYARAIDGLELAEHVVGYHDFDARVGAFEVSVDQDELDRFRGCREVVAELRATVDRVRLSSGFDAWKDAPRRNVHNDAKGPNCIIGPDGVRTIIDLDTTMPGTILSDIGELVRSSTRAMSNASSQELMAQIEAVNRGFLAGYGHDLLDRERDAMLLAGPLLAVENAVRFVADHLNGDKYYGAASPNQNLERGIAQLRLARRLIEAIEWATTS